VRRPACPFKAFFPSAAALFIIVTALHTKLS